MKLISNALHDELLALARDVREGRLVRKVEPSTVTTGTMWHTPMSALNNTPPKPANVNMHVVSTTEGTVIAENDAIVIELPDTVQRAAVAFAYGDARQVSVNEAYARQALARGEDAADVIRALQDGEEL